MFIQIVYFVQIIGMRTKHEDAMNSPEVDNEHGNVLTG